MKLLLLLATSALAQKGGDFGSFGGAPQARPPPPNIEPPLWFVPSNGAQSEEKCQREGEDKSTQIFQSPTSEIFIPEGQGPDICIFFAPPQPQKWQLGKGLPFKGNSCSEGCCFYIPAASRRVQEEEAKNEKNLFEWYRTSSSSCDGNGEKQTTRILLNKDKGSTANICAKKQDGGYDLLEGDAISCKGKCCGFGCKSCPKE